MATIDELEARIERDRREVRRRKRRAAAEAKAELAEAHRVLGEYLAPRFNVITADEVLAWVESDRRRAAERAVVGRYAVDAPSESGGAGGGPSEARPHGAEGTDIA